MSDVKIKLTCTYAENGKNPTEILADSFAVFLENSPDLRINAPDGRLLHGGTTCMPQIDPKPLIRQFMDSVDTNKALLVNLIERIELIPLRAKLFSQFFYRLFFNA